MLQVTFCELMPDDGALAQVRAAYAWYRRERGSQASDICFSVTLTRCADDTPTPFRAVIELVDAIGASRSVATQAVSIDLALRSAIAAARDALGRRLKSASSARTPRASVLPTAT
jgi:hypothetical protein